jgi:putative copper export protein
MAEEQELHEDGWQARDLRSGVAKVFQEAKRRSILGIRAGSAWAVIMLLYAIVDMAGVVHVGPPLWEFCAALGVMLLAALGMSRSWPQSSSSPTS